ncbi:MAG: Trk system potassium transporter TrkA [Alphaproteobacteria bacterium]|nr:Trk system potassium transporter TrkA [Alphaproteobacteria bacterium]
MKILIGGAGNVGRSIVDYLSQADNDIIVVDTDREKLDNIAKEFDVQTILGSISHPGVQEKIGAKDADILIAVTNDDEVNLVACQVAYSLFQVPKKIARVESEYFLNPLWNTLYSDRNLPVDLVISPDIEIAKNILNLLEFPGTTAVFPLVDSKLYLIGFKCDNACPLINTEINEIRQYYNSPVIHIIRDDKSFFAKPNETIHANDEIFVLVEKDNVFDTLHDFGVSIKPFENLVIFGGNAISYCIASSIEKDDTITNCKIVEDDKEIAQDLAENLNNVQIIKGEMMSDVILDEVQIKDADISVAITENDKDNLLASMVARKSGVPYTVSLVNSRAYDNLIDNGGENVIIERSLITTSAMLQDLRKAKINDAYCLRRGMGEVWEVRIDKDSLNTGKTIQELNLPDKCKVSAIYRNDEIIYNISDIIIEEGDILILFVSSQAMRKAEEIFKI